MAIAVLRDPIQARVDDPPGRGRASLAAARWAARVAAFASDTDSSPMKICPIATATRPAAETARLSSAVDGRATRVTRTATASVASSA